MVTGMEKPYVVGMDIGGTNTVFGIVDSRGNVLATDSVKTQSFSKIEDYVEAPQLPDANQFISNIMATRAKFLSSTKVKQHTIP